MKKEGTKTNLISIAILIFFVMILLVLPFNKIIKYENHLGKLDVSNKHVTFQTVNYSEDISNFNSGIHLDYIDNPTISILSNSDFENQGFPGSGTENDPFIIEGLNITSDGSVRLIQIHDTNVHFEIRNNYLSTGHHGIELFNVTNGVIKNNIVYNNSIVGILAYQSSFVSVESNEIDENRNIGIYFEDTNNSTISKNNVDGNFNDGGIQLPLSQDNIVTGNNITNNIGSGMYLLGSFNEITDNYVFNNTEHGIRLYQGSNNTINGNIAANNTLEGLNIYGSDENAIIKNFITNNTLNGIILMENAHRNTIEQNNITYNGNYGVNVETSSSNNIIKFNSFFNNSDTSQAYDSVGTNSFHQNYWNDWISPDDNNDGVVDDPYPIDGGSNTDQIPLLSLPEPIPPSINNPDDVEYQQNTIGNTIIWTVGDQNPGVYNVTIDNNPSIINQNWSNSTIEVNVDGLSAGTHELVIDIFDMSQNHVSDEIIITVYELDPPDVSGPNDFNFEYGTTGNTITWTVGDQNPGLYNIEIDNQIHISDTEWSNGTISINVDNLNVGTHVIEIKVFDEFGNVATDTVTVIVDDNSSDTDPEDVSSDPENNDEESVDNSLVIPIFVIAIPIGLLVMIKKIYRTL